MNLDLCKIVDALLEISEWPWTSESNQGGAVSVLDRNKNLRVLVYPKPSIEAFDPTNRDFISSSPVWLARLVVALVAIQASYVEATNSRCQGPCAEDHARHLLGINPAKYIELKMRLENVIDVKNGL